MVPVYGDILLFLWTGFYGMINPLLYHLHPLRSMFKMQMKLKIWAHHNHCAFAPMDIIAPPLTHQLALTPHQLFQQANQLLIWSGVQQNRLCSPLWKFCGIIQLSTKLFNFDGNDVIQHNNTFKQYFNPPEGALWNEVVSQTSHRLHAN
jgi:hypothetical protein